MSVPPRSAPRLYVPLPLREGDSLALPPTAARHVQVLRLQPGMAVTLFNGQGGEHAATVERMGRSEVAVTVGAHAAVERELPVAITLAVGMPANDRMDALVEKATELGAAAIQPLMCERSVLRLSGERADKRREHWQGIAVAASEQCGRTRVPVVAPVCDLERWLRDGVDERPAARWVLSLGHDARPLGAVPSAGPELVMLSGPEGGLSPAEDRAAREAGFEPRSLGPRVLRADTAPLAALSWLALSALR